MTTTKIGYSIGDHILAPSGESVGLITKVLKRSLRFTGYDGRLYCFNAHGVLLAGRTLECGKIWWSSATSAIESKLPDSYLQQVEWADSFAVGKDWSERKHEFHSRYK